ncbi:MAG: amidohydrolase family protein [Gammaproteobacteria bacterium]|nr:amidohydrolase family protein [Gammaproteobacteria bacterium]
MANIQPQNRKTFSFRWLYKAGGYLCLSVVALIIGFFVLASYFNASYNPSLPKVNQRSIVLDHVSIIDVTAESAGDRIIPNQQIVIEQGQITAINPAGSPVNEHYTKLDLTGKYVIPGLFDMHVHIQDPQQLALALSYGFTSVRDLSGQKRHLAWKKQLNNKTWLGSNLFVSSPIINGASGHILNQIITTSDQAQQFVQFAHQQGFDLIKVYGYVNQEVYETIAKEASRLNMPVAKHAPHPVDNSNWEYLQGLQSLEHVEDIFQGPLNYEFDFNEAEKVAERLKQLNVPVTPTLTTFDHLTQLSLHKHQYVKQHNKKLHNPFYLDLKETHTIARWLDASEAHADYNQRELDFLKQLVLLLYKNEVPMVLGSDGGTMYTLAGPAGIREIELLAESGLPSFAIIKMATVNSAVALGVEEEQGVITKNTIADLVVLDENPIDYLQTIRSPFAVVKNGQFLDRSALKKIQLGAEETDSWFKTVVQIIDDWIWRNF